MSSKSKKTPRTATKTKTPKSPKSAIPPSVAEPSAQVSDTTTVIINPVYTTSRGTTATSMRDLITSDSIPHALLTAEFMPIGQLSKDGVVTHIKVMTPLGECALVIPDKDGMYTSEIEADHMYHHTPEPATFVPFDVKTGYASCADPNICGLALECEGQVCTLTREGLESVPKEVMFSLKHKEDGKEVGLIQTKGTTHAYPIVRLSEILADKNAVHQAIHKNTLAIHKYEMDLLFSQCTVVEAKLKTLCDKYKHLFAKDTTGPHTGENMFQKILCVHALLHSYYEQYKKIDSPETRLRQSEVVHQMRIRMDAYRQAVSFALHLSDVLLHDIGALIDKVNVVAGVFDTTLAKLNLVMSE